MSKSSTVTGRIYEIIFFLLKEHKEGMRWTELLHAIQAKDSNLHPKTVNGCVWKIVEKFPEKVEKTEDGLFRLRA